MNKLTQGKAVAGNAPHLLPPCGIGCREACRGTDVIVDMRFEIRWE